MVKSIETTRSSLNFDADYGKDNFTQISDLSNSHAHNDLEFSMLKESEHLKNAIDINQHTRPTYDCQILENVMYLK